MDQFPQMLYRAGGDEEIHGGHFTTHIVFNSDELDLALADGWAETTPGALELAAARKAEALRLDAADDNAEPTRAELEQKAAELGIKFDGRWGDKKLADAIAAAMAA